MKFFQKLNEVRFALMVVPWRAGEDAPLRAEAVRLRAGRIRVVPAAKLGWVLLINGMTHLG